MYLLFLLFLTLTNFFKLKNSFPTNSIVLELTDGFYKMDNSGVSGMLLQQISNEFSNALTINKMKTVCYL